MKTEIEELKEKIKKGSYEERKIFENLGVNVIDIKRRVFKKTLIATLKDVEKLIDEFWEENGVGFNRDELKQRLKELGENRK